MKSHKTQNFFSRFLNLNDFPNFLFWSSCWNQKLEKLLNLSKFLLFEEIGNLRGFRVFEFGLYIEIDHSQNLEYFPRLLNLSKLLLFQKIWGFLWFRSFWFCPLFLNQKLGKLGNFFKSCNCLVGGSSNFPRFPTFRFYPFYWYQKLEKFENFLTVSKFD